MQCGRRAVMVTVAAMLVWLVSAAWVAAEAEEKKVAPVLSASQENGEEFEATGEIVQPMPLLSVGPGEHSRNPFDEPLIVPAPHDYAVMVKRVKLRGIISTEGRTVGLFAVADEDAGEDEQLRRYEKNETIMVNVKESEYLFTVQSFDRRSVHLLGGDEKTYKVWL